MQYCVIGSFIALSNLYGPINTSEAGFIGAVGGTKFACSSGIYSDIDLTRLLVRLSRLGRGGSRVK